MILTFVLSSFFTFAAPTTNPITINDAKKSIAIAADSPFLKHLKEAPVQAANTASLLKEKSLAVAVKENGEWKFYKEEIGPLLAEPLKTIEDKGYNLVVRARFSRELSEKLKNNDEVAVEADNFTNEQIPASILLISKGRHSDTAEVFIATKVEGVLTLLDFYWVDFKYNSLQTYLIPLDSILYISNEEYVLKKTAPNTYVPKNISIVSQTLKGAVVYGGLQASDSVLAEGAILLKPIVDQLVAPTYESHK